MIQIAETDFCIKLAELCYGVDITHFEATSKVTQAIMMTMYTTVNGNKHAIITSAFEHHAVLNPCQALERSEYPVAYMWPSREGHITAEILKEYITGQTHLTSWVILSCAEYPIIMEIATQRQLRYAQISTAKNTKVFIGFILNMTHASPSTSEILRYELNSGFIMPGGMTTAKIAASAIIAETNMRGIRNYPYLALFTQLGS